MKKKLIIASSILAVILIGVLVLNFSQQKESPTPLSDTEVVVADEQESEELDYEIITDSVSVESSATPEVYRPETAAPIKSKGVVSQSSKSTTVDMIDALNEPTVTEDIIVLNEVQEVTEEVEQGNSQAVEQIIAPIPETYQQPKVEVEIAKKDQKHKSRKTKRTVKYPINKSFIHNIAIVAGTDVGAAAPWPLSHLLSSGDKFFGTPRITPTVGLRYVLPVSQIWSFGVNVIYKRVCLDAITRVTNQRYYDADSEFLQYFSGTAQATMEFAMWEIPAYAKYTFPYSNHSILIGAYGAWRPKSIFESVAQKGYVGSAPDICDGIVDSDLQMSFTKSLREFEIGTMAGYEYRISRHFGVGARLYVGLTDIFIPAKRSLSYKMIPIRGSVLLSYQIFSKKDTPNRQ